MLFTNKTDKELKAFLDKNIEPDFAKAGTKATFTVFLEKGCLSHDNGGLFLSM